MSEKKKSSFNQEYVPLNRYDSGMSNKDYIFSLLIAAFVIVCVVLVVFKFSV